MKHRRRPTTPYQLTTLVAVAVSLLILFVLGGYFFFLAEPTIAPQQNQRLADLEANRALWESRRPVSFEYVIERVCYCSPDYTLPYVATERSGYRTARYIDSPDSGTAVQSLVPPDVVWLDDLFDMIASAAEDTDRLDVAYDPEFGFPVRLAIDRSTGSIDEEVRFYVHDFSQLPDDAG